MVPYAKQQTLGMGPEIDNPLKHSDELGKIECDSEFLQYLPKEFDVVPGISVTIRISIVYISVHISNHVFQYYLVL